MLCFLILQFVVIGYATIHVKRHGQLLAQRVEHAHDDRRHFNQTRRKTGRFAMLNLKAKLNPVRGSQVPERDG